jgi:hypothetical protein
MSKYDGMQIDSILIDQAKFSETMRQVWAGNLDLTLTLCFQLADCMLKITLYKRCVRAD